MKKIYLIAFSVLLLASCGKYNKALKSDDVDKKFTLAKEYYEIGIQEEKKSKLNKAIRLLEQIQPALKGKPQDEVVSYMIANAYYTIGDHFISGYRFDRYAKSFPDSPKIEEVLYKSANSYYEVSPKYSLDQQDTHKAIDKLQFYVNAFEDGEFFNKANEQLAVLRDKLERKDYEVAKQLHHRRIWRPAIHALGNFIDNHPGSKYNEKAYFYKFEAQFIYAVNSFRAIERERLELAVEYYNDFVTRYPESEFMELAKEHKKEIDDELYYLELLDL